MSSFIDLVETFDLCTLKESAYSKKIEGLLNRFPKFKNDCRYRTVLPQKYAKSADDYLSMKFCTRGRVPVYGIYIKRDLHLVAVCVEGIMYALDHASTDLHASFVPDLKFRKVDLGIQHTPLAATESVSYIKESMCSAISSLSLGYTPEKKNEWCNAIVLLTGITSQAARFSEMKRRIEIGLQTKVYHDRGFYPDSRILGLINRWNKISKAVRRGECPYIYTHYIGNRRSNPSTVCEEYTGVLTISLINDKNRTREKFRRINVKWDEKRVRKRITRKRKEKRKRKHVIRMLNKKYNTDRWKKTNNKRVWESMNNSHGHWYGSVDTLKYKVASVKCLLRPTQVVIDNRFLASATPLLDRLMVVLQVQITRASVLPVLQNIWNERGLLAFSPVYRYPFLAALRVSYRKISDCTRPVFTAAEFYLCAKRHKVNTSLKDLFFHYFEISTEKKDSSKVKGNQEHRPCVQLGYGRFSGALGATCVYPLLAMRTRMQAQYLNANDAYSGMSDVYRGFLQHQHEGLRGFYMKALKIWTKKGLLIKK